MFAREQISRPLLGFDAWLIGTNNTRANTAGEIAEGIGAVVLWKVALARYVGKLFPPADTTR